MLDSLEPLEADKLRRCEVSNVSFDSGQVEQMKFFVQPKATLQHPLFALFEFLKA